MSIAVIAMVVGMSLNTPFVVGLAGSAGPLVYIISTIGVFFIALSFVRLSGKVGHAGSVYGLVRYSLGPSSGFIAGWALLFTYTLFVGAALFGFGVFASFLFGSLVDIPWPVYSLGAGAAVWLFSYKDIRLSTRLMLVIELTAISLLVILSLVILSQTQLSLTPFAPGSQGVVGVGKGLVFGVLTFIGFEAAASMGEESRDPRRDIPFAILATVIVAGTLFTFVTYAQTVGFGLDNMNTFSKAATPVSDLSERYANPLLTTLVSLGALISNFAMAIASANAASRLMLALSRDGFIPVNFSSFNRFGSPKAAVNLVMLINATLIFVLAFLVESASNLYGYFGALATLTVLIAYAMMSLAALYKFGRLDLQEGRYYRLIPPVASIILAAYIMFANLYPVPEAPFNLFPYLVLGYMAAGGVILWVSRLRWTSSTLESFVLQENASGEDADGTTVVENVK